MRPVLRASLLADQMVRVANGRTETHAFRTDSEDCESLVRVASAVDIELKCVSSAFER